MKRVKPRCTVCGGVFAAARYRAGYRVCLFCGEEAARTERTHWCIAPLHKSNYILITDPTLLVGLNNKGGLIK